MRVEGPRCPSAADVKLSLIIASLQAWRETLCGFFPLLLLPPSFLSFPLVLMGCLFHPPCLLYMHRVGLLCTAVRQHFDGHPLMFLSIARCCSPPLRLSSLSLHAPVLITTRIKALPFFLTAFRPCFAFVFFPLSHCSITFVFTPPQSLLAVWYPRKKKEKKNSRARLTWHAQNVFSPSFDNGGTVASLILGIVLPSLIIS